MNERLPRIAVFWSRLPAYAFASLQSLQDKLGESLRVFSLGEPPAYFGETPEWKNSGIRTLPRRPFDTDLITKIMAEMDDFRPDFAFLTGWSLPCVRQLAPALKSRKVFTVCMSDTPWQGNMRQFLRGLLGRRMIRNWYDAMWVPGERGRLLAEFAGFHPDRVWMNLYCADVDGFCHPGESNPQRNREFLFTGRLVPAKNIRLLARAYSVYRNRVDDPWSLRIVGEGEERHHLEGIPGVVFEGRKSQEESAKIMAAASCFILPSIYEPWGVVVHEAAASGLPLILSHRVGSGPEFLRDGINGRMVNAANPDEMAGAMIWIHNSGKIEEMGGISRRFATVLTPVRWADYVTMKCREQMKRNASSE